MEPTGAVPSTPGVLSYTLCALTATGVILNTALALWHGYQLRAACRSFLAHSTLLSVIAHVLLGVAIILLTLQEEVTDQQLCHSGGFLAVFSSLELLWINVASAVSMCIKIVSAFSTRQTNKYGLFMFWLVMFTKVLILAVFVLLPFTKSHPFGHLHLSAFACIPIMKPFHLGWKYTSFIFFLYWTAILSGIIIVIIALTLVFRGLPSDATKVRRNKAMVGLHVDCVQLKRGIYPTSVTIMMDMLIWAALLIPICAFVYGNLLTDKALFQWILGYCISAYLLIHPAVCFASKRVARNCIQESEYLTPCKRSVRPVSDRSSVSGFPDKLDTVRNLQPRSSSPEVQKKRLSFLVQWREGVSTFSGLMKVFPMTVRSHWCNEVAVLQRLSDQPLRHRYAAEYFWASGSNAFASVVGATTGVAVSPYSSIMCRKYYPLGSLHTFLLKHTCQLTDIGLHKIILNVAQAINFLHQQLIVHNRLSTHTFFLASTSERVGTKVVMGDFEDASILPPATGRSSDPMAVDIRSFALILLEILGSCCTAGYKKTIPFHFAEDDVSCAAKALDDINQVGISAVKECPTEPLARRKSSKRRSKKRVIVYKNKNSAKQNTDSQPDSTENQIKSVSEKQNDDPSNSSSNGYISMDTVRANKLSQRPLPPLPPAKFPQADQPEDEVSLSVDSGVSFSHEDVPFSPRHNRSHRKQKMPCIKEHDIETSDEHVSPPGWERAVANGLDILNPLNLAPNRYALENEFKPLHHFKKTAIVRPISVQCNMDEELQQSENSPKDQWPSGTSLDESMDSGFLTGGSQSLYSGGGSDISSLYVFNKPRNRGTIYDCSSNLHEHSFSIYRSMVELRQDQTPKVCPSKSDQFIERHKNVNEIHSSSDELYEAIGSARTVKTDTSSSPVESPLNSNVVNTAEQHKNSTQEVIATSESSLYESNVSLASAASDSSREMKKTKKMVPNLGVSSIKYRQSKLSLTSQSTLTDSIGSLNAIGDDKRGATVVDPPFDDIAGIELKPVINHPAVGYKLFHKTTCEEIGRLYGHVASDVVWERDRESIRDMLDAMKQTRKVAYTPVQVMPLFETCWLDGPAPDLRTILEHLNNLLPSSSV